MAPKKAGAAKTASKNAPSQRKKAKVITFNSKPIEPVKFIDLTNGSKQLMAAQYVDTKDLITDQTGSPIPWSEFA